MAKKRESEPKTKEVLIRALYPVVEHRLTSEGLARPVRALKAYKKRPPTGETTEKRKLYDSLGLSELPLLERYLFIVDLAFSRLAAAESIEREREEWHTALCSMAAFFLELGRDRKLPWATPWHEQLHELAEELLDLNKGRLRRWTRLSEGTRKRQHYPDPIQRWLLGRLRVVLALEALIEAAGRKRGSRKEAAEQIARQFPRLKMTLVNPKRSTKGQDDVPFPRTVINWQKKTRAAVVTSPGIYGELARFFKKGWAAIEKEASKGPQALKNFANRQLRQAQEFADRQLRTGEE